MKLRILREAEEEAHASAIWYDDQLVGLGDGFLDELVAALQQIEDDPDRFPKLETAKSKQIRRCPCGQKIQPNQKVGNFSLYSPGSSAKLGRSDPTTRSPGSHTTGEQRRYRPSFDRHFN